MFSHALCIHVGRVSSADSLPWGLTCTIKSARWTLQSGMLDKCHTDVATMVSWTSLDGSAIKTGDSEGEDSSWELAKNVSQTQWDLCPKRTSYCDENLQRESHLLYPFKQTCLAASTAQSFTTHEQKRITDVEKFPDFMSLNRAWTESQMEVWLFVFRFGVSHMSWYL